MTHNKLTNGRMHALMAAAVGTLTMLLLFMASPPATQAASFEVTSDLDDGSGGTLREAITDAAGNAEADTITFAAGLDGATITLDPGNGELAINDDVTIDASALENGITIAADGSHRVFNISGGTVTIRGLTITGGGGVVTGGGISNNGGDVDLDSVIIRGNSATGSGAGVAHESGTMNIGNSTITDNTIAGTTSDYGGAIRAAGAGLSIGYTTIADNPRGGIIAVNNDVLVIGTILSNNDTGAILTGPNPDENPANCLVFGTGTHTSQGYNIDDDTSCGFAGTGDSTADPQITAVGTPTEYYEPAEASPAVDAIPAVSPACDIVGLTDQIGTSRPQGDGCEIGSIEFVPPAPELSITKWMTSTMDMDVVLPGETVTYTLAFSNTGNLDATDAVVTDIVPLELYDLEVATSGDFSPTALGSTYDWQFDIPADSTVRYITITGVLTDGLQAGTLIVNTAEITVTDDADPTNNVTDDVTFTVGNAAPVAVDDDGYVTDDTTPLTITNALDNDSDANGDELVITEVTVVTPTGSTATASAITTDTIEFTPVAGVTGTHVLTYTVEDPDGLMDTAYITITVEDTPETNQPPTAGDITESTDIADVLLIDVSSLVSDPDGDDLTLDIGPAVPSLGEATVSTTATSTIIYSPTTTVTGTDTFEYTVSDPDGESATGTITVILTDRTVEPPVDEANLQIEVSTTVTSAKPGDTIDYTITITNTGPAVARNLTATIDLADGLTLASTTSAAWTCGTNDPVVCTRATLAVDLPTQIIVSATVNEIPTSTVNLAVPVGTLVTTAQVDADNSASPATPPSNTSTITLDDGFRPVYLPIITRQ